jgi:hypothetical protein
MIGNNLQSNVNTPHIKQLNKGNGVLFHSPSNSNAFYQTKGNETNNNEENYSKFFFHLDNTGFDSTGFKTKENFQTINKINIKEKTELNMALLAFNSFSLFSNKDPLSRAITQSKQIKYFKGDEGILPDADFDTLFKCSPEFRSRKSTNNLSTYKLTLITETNKDYIQIIEEEEENGLTNESCPHPVIKEEPIKYKYSIYCDKDSACQIPEGCNYIIL